MLEGCLAWQHEGLAKPAAVAQATTIYREEQDELGAFLAECTVELRGAKLSNEGLRQVYRAWCERNGSEPRTVKALALRLKRCGHRSFRGRIGDKVARGWIGIDVRPEFDPNRHIAPQVKK